MVLSNRMPAKVKRRLLALGEALFPRSEFADVERPKTRGDCVDGPRPCPFAGCRYHLALDVHPRTGSITLNAPGVEIEDMAETCALDVADRGRHRLISVGDLLNMTRERVRQIEGIAAKKIRDAEPSLRDYTERDPDGT